jgi:acyl transferase domain-containing protein
MVVPVEASPWPKGRAERMSVGSYGIGGSNVHVSLEFLYQMSTDSNASYSLSSTLLPRSIWGSPKLSRQPSKN